MAHRGTVIPMAFRSEVLSEAVTTQEVVCKNSPTAADMTDRQIAQDPQGVQWQPSRRSGGSARRRFDQLSLLPPGSQGTGAWPRQLCQCRTRLTVQDRWQHSTAGSVSRRWPGAADRRLTGRCEYLPKDDQPYGLISAREQPCRLPKV